MESLSVKIFFRLIVIAVCAVVRPLSLQSAGYGEGNLNFYHIGIDAGLSQMQINSLYQDEYGLLWIGARDGVKYYDGNKVTPLYFGNQKSWILSNFVPTICGDGSGHLYINANYSIIKYDLKSGSHEEIFTQDNTRVPPAIAFHYGEDYLWIGLKGDIFRYGDDGELSWFASIDDADAEISTLTVSDSSVWAGTKSSGLWKIDVGGDKSVVLTDCSEIVTLFEDSSGTIWCGTLNRGLFGIGTDGSTVNYTASGKLPLANDFVRAVSEDDEGNLWIGTAGGLNILNAGSGEMSYYGFAENDRNALSNLSIWTIMKDAQGTMWIGSYYGGIDYCNTGSDRFAYYEFRKESGNAYSLVSDMAKDRAGNLWIGTEGNGLVKLDPSGTVTFVDAAFSAYNIKALKYNPKGNYLWVGTHQGGLYKYMIDSGRCERYVVNSTQMTVRSESVQDMEISRGYMYLGTLQGVFRMNLSTEEIEPVPALNRYVFSADRILVSRSDGKIWIAGNILCNYDSNTGKVELYDDVFTEFTGSSEITSTSLYEDADGRIYVGTLGFGVLSLNPSTGEKQVYNTLNMNLAGDYIGSICGTTDDNLLIGTNAGLSWIDRISGRSLVFNVQNGFPLHSMVPGCISEGTAPGDLVIGGINGMVMTSEHKLLERYLPSKLFFSGLWVNNRRVTADDGSGILKENLRFVDRIDLAHDQNDIMIELGLNNPAYLSQPVCRYRLEGLNREWISHFTNTPITFTNLPYGKYELTVKYDSAASMTEQISMQIRIRPPFYASWYAFVFYSVFIVGMVVWIFYFFYSRIMFRTSIEMERNNKEQIEAVNASKIRFFGNMSHELRTPLSLMIGQLEIFLDKEKITSGQRERLEEVLDDTRKMRSLINEQLDMLKLDQGALRMSMAEEDIVPLVRNVCSKFGSMAEIKNISLDFRTDTECCMVAYDSVQMGRVFNNLLSNAVKYTGIGGHIRVRISSPADGRVSISVTDDGIGIPEDMTEKIFDRFFQVDNAINKDMASVGSGIGLSYTKSIIEAHSGTVSVSSKVGHGSVFTVSLPCVPNKLEILPPPTASDETGNPAVSKRKSRLLIVEDDPAVRRMLVSIFDEQYDVSEASNGEEGIAAASKKIPDLIISDVMMPVMSGYDFCSRIKSNFDTSHIPVILLTALSDVDNNIKGLDCGADDYITKPFNVKLLEAKCRNILSNRALMQKRFLKEDGFSSELVAGNDGDREFLDNVVALIEKCALDGEVSVTLICDKLAMSHTKLFNKIKGITGQSPQQFIYSVKLKLAAEMLRKDTSMNISEISDKLGFSSINYFGKCFKAMYGKSPSSYRKYR